MLDVQGDFYQFEDVTWLNAASEGPLPNVAAKALEQAVQWKSSVYTLDIPKFIQVPLELRQSIAKLINVDARDVILGTSASYGLHLLADGIQWESGDEVVVMENDFPTNILPWLDLEHRGVVVKQIKPAGPVLTSQEIADQLTAKTRIVCLSHVHTFSGYMLQAAEIGEICRARGIKFILNIAQSLGTMPVDVASLNADAIVSVGYKWLCGPYGTGFCWIDSGFRETLHNNRAYWSAYLTEEELSREGPLKLKDSTSARKYDVFGTANFFNFVPLRAAVDYWLDLGMDRVYQHNQALMNQLCEGLDQSKYRIISRTRMSERSNLFVFSAIDDQQNSDIFERLKQAKIFGAFWKGNIRLSPHVYNSVDQIQKTVELLNRID